MTTTISIHAHDVLDLIYENDGKFSREELFTAMQKTFGEEATYYSCSAKGMSREELLTFLFDRQKIYEQNDKLSLNIANKCNH